MTKHSDKALTTIAQLGTTPDAWTLTAIDWIEEEREVLGLVRCPECDGSKWVRYAEDGTAIPVPALNTSDRFDYTNAARRESRTNGGTLYGSCRRCRGTRGRMRGYPTGKVSGLVMALVMVGYPRWPAGTAFGSRFAGGMRCHLCGKSIHKSGRVPVNTDGASPQGMWVGEDCARKFLNVKIKRTDDSIMEDAAAA